VLYQYYPVRYTLLRNWTWFVTGATGVKALRKRLWIAEVFGIFGLVAAASTFAYDFATNFSGSSFPVLLEIASVPAKLVCGPLFFDLNGHSIEGVFAMLFMTGVNALIYYTFGFLLLRLFVGLKPQNST
jgi:hypothetical protein